MSNHPPSRHLFSRSYTNARGRPMKLHSDANAVFFIPDADLCRPDPPRRRLLPSSSMPSPSAATNPITGPSCALPVSSPSSSTLPPALTARRSRHDHRASIPFGPCTSTAHAPAFEWPRPRRSPPPPPSPASVARLAPSFTISFAWCH